MPARKDYIRLRTSVHIETPPMLNYTIAEVVHRHHAIPLIGLEGNQTSNGN